MRNRILLLVVATFVSGCVTTGYSGKGGMTARSIKPDVYEYHYKNGFTGVDAMGWGPNLQYAWSRIGAGITCGIPFNKDALVDKLVAKYGHSEFVHDMNGIMFHHMQSKKIDSFCTADRLEEVKQMISETEVEKL